MKKLLITLILAFLTLFNIAPVSVLADTSIDGNIRKELADVDLKVYESANKTTLITLSEMNFASNDYKLIVYVYNAEKTVLNKNYSSNVINMATKYNDENEPVEYSNLKLKYISNTEDNAIYKFLIVDDGKVIKDNSAYQYARYGERRYDVAGIQLLNVTDRTAKDYNLGITYVYSGLEASKTHSLTTLETIELDVRPAWYRTNTSDKGKYYQNQLNSVYFSVPEKYFQDGYNLTAVKAEWYEYKTEPIVVINNDEVYNGLQSWLGKDIGKRNEDVPYNLYCGLEAIQVNALTNYYHDWTFNLEKDRVFPAAIYHTDSYLSRLTYLFSTKGAEASSYVLPSEELFDYIYNYNKSADKGCLDVKNGQISADLFQDGVDDGRARGYNCVEISVEDTYDLLSYSDTHSWWVTVCDYGFFNTIFGNVPAGEESKRDVTPIYQVKPEDLTGDVEEKLLISSELVEDFTTYFNAQTDKRTFMFRFANTDYKVMSLDSHDGYVAEETVFLDFDVIHLRFSNGESNIVYPTISNPIDVIPSPTPPPEETLDWVIYAIIGVALSVAVIVLYQMYKGEFN